MWLLTTISLPHLRGHLWRTALTVLGIAVGVAAMIATTSVTDAVFASFQRSVEVSVGRAQLHVSNGTTGVPEDLVEALRTLPDVAAAAPIVTGFVSVAGPQVRTLAVFGLDLLADEEHDVQLPRSAIHIPDDIEFVSGHDSIAVTGRFAREQGLQAGERIDVITAHGAQRLTVRGVIDEIGPATLFGGAVGLMDLPAAQRLLGVDERVDQIDVRVRSGANVEDVKRLIAQTTVGRGMVDDTQAHGTRVQDLFFSVRVMLSIAALVAVVVGFFIIYHTVSVSVLQRRREMGLLNAVGVSRRSISWWLSTEAVLFGTIAGLLGYAIGMGIAGMSLSTFGTVVTAFARVPEAQVAFEPWRLALAVSVAIASTLGATLIPAIAILRDDTARALRPSGGSPAGALTPARSVAAGVLGLSIAATMIATAPTTLPYGPLVAFIFTLNSLVLVSCGLFCPLGAAGIGALVGTFSTRSRGLVLLLAGRAIGRNPAGAVAVVTAIVMGMGWTLADVSLIESFRGSWLTWIDRHYTSDLILSAGPATVSFLTAPPVAEEVLEAVRAIPGVAEVQGLQISEISRDGKPTVIQAFDETPSAPPVGSEPDHDRDQRFWNGDGVMVNQQLAHLEGIRAGEFLSLSTPSGAQHLRVLGTFVDYRVGYLSSIAMSRNLYRTLWGDRSITTARVWVKEQGVLEEVRDRIERQIGSTYGMHAVTAAEFRGAVSDLTESIFALHYAVVLIALLVSIVGVTNFLLSSVADRGNDFRMLAAAGVPPQQVSASIVIEGALLGVVGCALGLAAGYASSRIIVLHSVPMVNGWGFEFRFPAATALRLCVAAIGLAAMASWLPARLAQRRLATGTRY